jgi:hypothetical protein
VREAAAAGDDTIMRDNLRFEKGREALAKMEESMLAQMAVEWKQCVHNCSRTLVRCKPSTKNHQAVQRNYEKVRY